MIYFSHSLYTAYLIREKKLSIMCNVKTEISYTEFFLFLYPRAHVVLKGIRKILYIYTFSRAEISKKITIEMDEHFQSLSLPLISNNSNAIYKF